LPSPPGYGWKPYRRDSRATTGADTTLATESRSPRFIGRIVELGTLDQARRELARGRGSLTLIEGEAGIGKSRLVAHALRAVAGGRSGRVVTVDCVPETHAELYPVRAALAAIWQPDTTAGVAALVLRTIAQLLPDEAGPELIARYTGATLGKAELFAGLGAAFAFASAKRGTILVLEDIHWADPGTLEFLASLAPRLDTMRLMVIATTRSEAFERNATADAASRLLRARSVRQLVLKPLLRTEVAELIDAALAGRSPIAASTLTAIIERSEGNPFFAEELLKAAVEQHSDLPRSIRSGIRHRLAALAPDDREMLDVAAVLGVRFDHTLLAALCARAPADVVRMLRRARDSQLVDEIDATLFRFHHALTRQTIYDELLAAEAQALHRRILTALEGQTETEWTIEALAYHAWQAADAAAALRYSERAGERALERGLFADAQSYFERILPAVDDDGVRARLHERLGAVATAQGDFAAARAALEAALALRIEHDNLDDAARIAVALAVELSNSGGDPVAGLEAFLSRFSARLSVRARDGVLVFLARLMTALGRFEHAGELLSDISALEQLEPRVRANYLTCRLNMSEHAGTATAWRAAAHEMLDLAPQLPPLMRSIQLTNVAQTGAWLGEGAITQRALAEAQTIARHWGFEGILVFSRAVEALLAFLTGDLDTASAALDAVARRPDVAPAQILAAQIGPFVAAERNDDVLGARYRDAAAANASRAADADDGDDTLYADAALLAIAPQPGAAVIGRLAARLTALAPGAFFPPTVGGVAALNVSRAGLPAFIAAADAAAAAGTNAVVPATRDLIRAIAARRLGESDDGAAASAARQFRDLGWPVFERLARAQALSATPDTRTPAALLTARETEIAGLIAAGLTNSGIAGQLHVGVKTVEKHVSNILMKLGARSRAQIAAFVSASGRDGQLSSTPADI
jgi:DNA-binding CsgD family transcriptional regulator